MNVSLGNASDGGEASEPIYACLLLLVVPIICIFGNLLVILSVLLEKSLQTTTNFLLVSLAAADLLVGCLVMPFSVYLAVSQHPLPCLLLLQCLGLVEVHQLEWYLGRLVCNLFCVMDVAGSTSSIVHLVAISMDRFFAVVRHTEYKTAKHRRRVYFTIVLTWVFSLLIALPLDV